MAVAANALTLLTTAKDHLNIPDATTTYDAQIERLINVASNLIAKKCNRILVDTTHTDEFDGRSSNRILLREYPVQSITSIAIDSNSVFPASSIIASDEYAIVDKETTVLRLNGGIFPKGYRNIQIVYVAGLGVVNTGLQTNTYPPDLEYAALDYVLWLYDMNNDRRIGRTSKSKGGESVEYEERIPKSVVDQIAPYVRVEFPELEVGIRNI